MRTEHSEDDYTANFNSFNWDEYNISKNYTDGLGRPIQSIGMKASPLDVSTQSAFDIVSFTGYDQYERTPVQYLSYVDATDNGSFKDDVIQKQLDFYNAANPGIENSAEFMAVMEENIKHLLNIRRIMELQLLIPLTFLKLPQLLPWPEQNVF
jgi:hypothetical protein